MQLGTPWSFQCGGFKSRIHVCHGNCNLHVWLSSDHKCLKILFILTDFISRAYSCLPELSSTGCSRRLCQHFEPFLVGLAGGHVSFAPIEESFELKLELNSPRPHWETWKILTSPGHTKRICLSSHPQHLLTLEACGLSKYPKFQSYALNWSN